MWFIEDGDELWRGYLVSSKRVSCCWDDRKLDGCSVKLTLMPQPPPVWSANTYPSVWEPWAACCLEEKNRNMAIVQASARQASSLGIEARRAGAGAMLIFGHEDEA
jgi:hypothetical protein